LVVATKKCFFAGRGEPYRIGDEKQRFATGTRPMRLHYRISKFAIKRRRQLKTIRIAVLFWRQANKTWRQASKISRGMRYYLLRLIGKLNGNASVSVAIFADSSVG
jgi:hypothetical protein